MEEFSLSETWSRLCQGLHDGESVPLELVSVEGAGRGLRATADISPGQVLMTEAPIVSGPSSQSGPTDCAGCGSSSSPSSCCCGLTFCTASCRSSTHSQEECQAVTRIPHPRPHIGVWLVAIRAVLKKDERIKLLENHKDVDDTVVKLVTEATGESEEEVKRVIGVLDSNCFRLNVIGKGGRVLYGLGSMVNHSCAPNCRTYWDHQGRLVLTSKVHIRPGEDLHITYCSPLMGLEARQDKLLRSKFFRCRCRRCLDKEDGGSNLSGVKCPKCKCSKCNLLPGLHPDGELDWICQCGFKADSRKVTNLLKTYETELEGITSMSEGSKEEIEKKVDKLENFIKSKRKILSPSHHLLLTAGGDLIQLLPQLQITLDRLDRRAELCRERLDVLDKVERGYSRMRGIFLYKLHHVLFYQVRLLSGKGPSLKLSNLASELHESLLEASHILEGDAGAPPDIQKSAQLLRTSLEEVNRLEEVEAVARRRYQ